MSVGIEDAMVQWDAILHTDLHIAEIRHALKRGHLYRASTGVK